MADAFDVTLTGEWGEFLRAIRPGEMARRLQEELRKATTKNCLLVKSAMRKRIQDRAYLPNSPLTLAIKAPRTKPLIGGPPGPGGDLFRAITHEVSVRADGEPVGFVGLLRTDTHKGTRYNIGIILHEGATIRVTPAMRRAVFAKARRNGKGRRYLRDIAGPARGTWVIPPRPFVRDVIQDPAIQRALLREWEAGVDRALRGRP